LTQINAVSENAVWCGARPAAARRGGETLGGTLGDGRG
jgi:hypothetical protein